MLSDLAAIEKEAVIQISEARSLQDLESLRIKYLGRKGVVSKIISGIPNLPLEERPTVGGMANRLKQRLLDLIETKRTCIKREIGAKRTKMKVDVSLPGIRQEIGHKHPITCIIEEVCDIFVSLGFKVVEGPEIEREYYNFEALNMPLGHPSRDTFDTFYLKEDILLRSHTSPVQIRVMERERPPLAVVVPGKVYRPDAVDASHSFMFHQVEGFMVDKGVRFSDLKGVLAVFVRRMFGGQTLMRFRPHFFPFTEPSAEVDISCIICRSNQKKTCSVCGGKGWLEILGAGMIHPNVFKYVKYNPEEFTGFAFGMGIERIAMLKYDIHDIRLFFENDLRFLQQF